MAEHEPIPEPIQEGTKESAERLEGELSPETLELMQRTFDFLGIKKDVTKEYATANIIFPTPEQVEEAKELGYTFPLLIDGTIGRKRFIRRAQKAFAEEFGSKGIVFQEYTQTQYAYYTKESQHSTRPQSLYVIYLKPDQEEEVEIEHPKNAKDCQTSLRTQQSQNPSLNIKGLTVPEYIYFIAALYQRERAKGNIPDPRKEVNLPKSWTRLLSEVVYNSSSDPLFCLKAYWYNDGCEIHIGSDNYSDPSSIVLGARFAVVPGELETQPETPES